MCQHLEFYLTLRSQRVKTASLHPAALTHTCECVCARTCVCVCGGHIIIWACVCAKLSGRHRTFRVLQVRRADTGSLRRTRGRGERKQQASDSSSVLISPKWTFIPAKYDDLHWTKWWFHVSHTFQFQYFSSFLLSFSLKTYLTPVFRRLTAQM